MERILIIGCPGSGKTTLARRLSELRDLPVVHLDKLFWLAGWKERDKNEFDGLLLDELKKPNWIIDGNYGRTLPQRLQYCDTVIYLDFSRWICVAGVLKRILSHRGKTRPDMGDGCPERFDRAFLTYVWKFNQTNRAKLLSRIEAADPSVQRIVLRNRRDVARFLASL